MDIDQPGEYILTSDLTDSANCNINYWGGGIRINVSDVVLDCDGHTINTFGRWGVSVSPEAYSEDWPTNITIRNCIINGSNTSNGGIYIREARDVLIENNFINCSGSSLIRAQDGERVTIRNNIGYNSEPDGFPSFMGISSSHTLIDNNTFIPWPDTRIPSSIDRRQVGINVWGRAQNITISNNLLPTNSFAITIDPYIEYYHIINNTLGVETDYHTERCLKTAGSHGIIENNWIYADYGPFELDAKVQRLNSTIYYNSGVNNTIRNNIIKGNDPVDIGGDCYSETGSTFYPTDTKFYNNYIYDGNDIMTTLDSSTSVGFGPGRCSANNLWPNVTAEAIKFYNTEFNTTKQNGNRIYGLGTDIGGNYWTNSYGSGYSDTCNDNNIDGFCDEPLVLRDSNDTVDNIDYLPLSNKFGSCELGENYKLNITSPQLADSWSGTQNITWELINIECSDSALVNIEVYFGGSKYKPFVSYQVPINNLVLPFDTTQVKDGTAYQIYIEYINNVGIYDISLMFTINNAPPPPPPPTTSSSSTSSPSGPAPPPSEILSLTSLFTTKSVSVGGGTKVNLGGSQHTVTVTSVSGDEATITVQSDPITFNLKVGQEKIVDVDANSRYLLNVKLNGIKNKILDLSFRQVLRETNFGTTAETPKELENPQSEAEIQQETPSPFAAITGGTIFDFKNIDIKDIIYLIIVTLPFVLMGIFLFSEKARKFATEKLNKNKYPHEIYRGRFR